jgi:hypothetical protein
VEGRDWGCGFLWKTISIYKLENSIKEPTREFSQFNSLTHALTKLPAYIFAIFENYVLLFN